MKRMFLLALLGWASQQCAVAQSLILLDSPVKVTAETGVAAKTDPTSSGTPITLEIHQGTFKFRVAVRQRGNVSEALAVQKSLTGWKDGYLFVRDDCLVAGDDKRGARCVVDQVFTFVDGRDGKRLVHLGDIFSGDDCVEESKIGCALHQGAFTDIHDAFETNTLVRRAESPMPLLEIDVSSGELVVNLDATWGRNQERFSAGERCLTANAAERPMACTEGVTPRSAYLFNSVLAAYTRRTDQLMRIRAFARSALCDGDAEADCSEALRLSALMLASTRPGEKPRARGNVKTVPLAR